MEERAKKIFLMKVGIVALMTLIFIFWLLNIKNVFKVNQVNQVENDLKWGEVRDELGETLDQLGDNFQKINETNENLKAASSSLVNEIIKEADKIASSSTASSSIPVKSETVSEEGVPEKPNSANCPEYINCMPTIGEMRPCIIPVGCEGITQIAY